MSVSRTSNPNASSGQDSMISKIMHRLATPLTTGLFLVSAVSGVALFFRWLPGAFHTMHVWLSMVLLVPIVFHVWRNARSLLGYARRGTLTVPLALCLAAAVPFAASGLSDGGRHGGNPGSRAIALMTQARLSDLAPVLGLTPDALIATLRQRGYRARSADETLDTVAATSGRRSSELLFTVMSRR